MKWTGWGEEQIAVLRKSWGKDAAAEIAAELGCTRNAVIGKAHRLKLPPCDRVEVQRRAATKRYLRIRQAAR
jgi:hypothetical protein